MATASTQLEVIIKAKDEASATLNNLKKDFGGLGSALASTAKVVAGAIAVASGAVVAFGVSAVNAYAESEAKMKVMNNTLKNLGGNIEANKKKIKEASDAVKRLGFDDDDTAQSITNLFVKTKDLNKAMELNAIAMDLARYKHISLSEASKTISMVMSGNGKALKDFDIKLDESKAPIDALREAHKLFAGSAEASADTLEVQKERIKNAYGDIQKAVGAIFDDNATKVMSFVADKLAQIAEIDFQGYWDRAVTSIKKLFSLIEEKGNVIQAFKDYWQVVVDFFNTYLKPMWDEMIDKIMKNKDFLAELIGNFAKFIGVLTAGGLIGIMTTVVTVMNLVSVAIDGLKWYVESLAEAFLDVERVITKAYTALKKYYDLASEKVGGVVSSVKKVFTGKATGGSVMAGQSYMVGERGAEMFTPLQSGTITPNGALSGGGSIVVNINGGTYLSESVAQDIGDMIINRFKRSVRL